MNIYIARYKNLIATIKKKPINILLWYGIVPVHVSCNTLPTETTASVTLASCPKISARHSLIDHRSAVIDEMVTAATGQKIFGLNGFMVVEATRRDIGGTRHRVAAVFPCSCVVSQRLFSLTLRNTEKRQRNEHGKRVVIYKPIFLT